MGLVHKSGDALVVTTTELRDHLQLYDFDFDAIIAEAQIKAATAYIERECRITLPPRTYELTLDGFPCDCREIRLLRPPCVSVDSVKYLDGDGEEQTLATQQYVVDATSQPGRIVLRPGYSWPATANLPAAVRITFTAGHETIPPLLRHAVLMLAGHYFAHREATSDRRVNDVPMAVQSIIDMHRFPVVAPW